MKYSSRELFKAKHHYSRMVVGIDLGGQRLYLVTSGGPQSLRLAGFQPSLELYLTASSIEITPGSLPGWKRSEQHANERSQAFLGLVFWYLHCPKVFLALVPTSVSWSWQSDSILAPRSCFLQDRFPCLVPSQMTHRMVLHAPLHCPSALWTRLGPASYKKASLSALQCSLSLLQPQQQQKPQGKELSFNNCLCHR